MTSFIYDYIVIGTGPAGAMAAQTITEAGYNILILDAGILKDKSIEDLPENDFIGIRSENKEQYKYFLGNNFESVELENIKTGAQLTPQRKYLIDRVNDLIPVESSNFFPMESLAYGGLGSGWGLGSYVYSDEELHKVGLDIKKIKKSYDVVAGRIGISASNTDDTAIYSVGYLKNLLPPLKYDNSIAVLYNNYLKHRDKLINKGIFFGNVPLALLSEDFGSRQKTLYNDLDFYSDNGYSAYRPWMTIDNLRKQENCKYLNNILVLSFKENHANNYIEVLARHIDTKEYISFRTKKLIIAAGALGTARIVMRSIPLQNKKLPLLCNPYTYLPCINFKMLGVPLDRNKTSMAQAVMFYDETKRHDDVVSVALYTYRSLLIYKLLKEAPLNFANTLKLMQYLQSAFVIAGIHHPDEHTENKYIQLIDEQSSFTGDKLKANYEQTKEEVKKISLKEKEIKWALRKLSCYPLKKINPGFGSSIHYAGTIPFDNKTYLSSLNPNGQLKGINNVFVADSSGFKYLPAKGITFTLMANAYNVALEALYD